MHFIYFMHFVNFNFHIIKFISYYVRFEYDKCGNRSKIEDLVNFPLVDLDLGPLIPNK